MTTIKRPALGIVSAALLSTFAFGAPAFAQTSTEAPESQLQMSVEEVFNQYGIQAEVQQLTLSQLAEIHLIVAESGPDTKQRIEGVLSK
ncbi:hypothetical protein [Palleronia rufa]|uniref:hypothetical protein n=1 Tax=Palleronia rufa TaxID=1530186 RepID=UPI00055F8071|nr:hypothetical protein [Palleronia rufa]